MMIIMDTQLTLFFLFIKNTLNNIKSISLIAVYIINNVYLCTRKRECCAGGGLSTHLTGKYAMFSFCVYMPKRAVHIERFFIYIY